jgi:DNA-binding NtrC family response regulator
MLMPPGIDGLETYKRATNLHPGQKAIITTGDSNAFRLADALEYGIVGFLKKPYRVNEIGITVQAALKKPPK